MFQSLALCALTIPFAYLFQGVRGMERKNGLLWSMVGQALAFMSYAVIFKMAVGMLFHERIMGTANWPDAESMAFSGEVLLGLLMLIHVSIAMDKTFRFDPDEDTMRYLLRLGLYSLLGFGLMVYASTRSFHAGHQGPVVLSTSWFAAWSLLFFAASLIGRAAYDKRHRAASSPPSP